MNSKILKLLLDDKENENEEFFRIMIDSARNGEYSSITDFIKDYDDFYNFV